jgi:hypothetical protein
VYSIVTEKKSFSQNDLAYTGFYAGGGSVKLKIFPLPGTLSTEILLPI